MKLMLKLVPILLLLGALGGGMYLSQRRQETRREAYFAGVSALFLPDARTVGVGEEFVSTMKLSSADKYVEGVDVKVKYDAAVLEVVRVEMAGDLGFTEVVNNKSTAGRIDWSGVDMRTDTAALKKGVFDVLKITFKGKSVGVAEVDLDSAAGNMVTGRNPGSDDVQFSITSTKARYTVGGGTTTITPTPRLSRSGITGAWMDDTFLFGVVSKDRYWNLNRAVGTSTYDQWTGSGKFADLAPTHVWKQMQKIDNKYAWEFPEGITAAWVNHNEMFGLISKDKFWNLDRRTGSPTRNQWSSFGKFADLPATNIWKQAPRVGGLYPWEGDGITGGWYSNDLLGVVSRDKYWTLNVRTNVWIASGYARDLAADHIWKQMPKQDNKYPWEFPEGITSGWTDRSGRFSLVSGDYYWTLSPAPNRTWSAGRFSQLDTTNVWGRVPLVEGYTPWGQYRGGTVTPTPTSVTVTPTGGLPTGGPKTCVMSVTGMGTSRTARVNGNGPTGSNSNVRYWLERADGTPVTGTSLGLGATRAYTGGGRTYNYLYLGSCSSVNAASCEVSITVNNLPAGDYFYHCDVIVPTASGSSCSGNPWCNYSVAYGYPGGDTCTGFAKCGTNDVGRMTVLAGVIPTLTPTLTPTPTSVIPTGGIPTNTPYPTIPMGTGSVDMRLIPSRRMGAKVGEDLTFYFNLTSGGNGISMIKADILIDPMKADIKEVSVNRNYFEQARGDSYTVQYFRRTGVVNFYLVSQKTGSELYRGVPVGNDTMDSIAKIVVTPKRPGSLEATFINRAGNEADVNGIDGQGRSTRFTVRSMTNGVALISEAGGCRVCSGTARKTSGDANCDGVVDGLDFEIWRNESYDQGGADNDNANWNANFNCPLDQKVDGLDFEIWRPAALDGTLN